MNPSKDTSDTQSPPLAPPSGLFLAQGEALAAATAYGPLVDLACGRGRHCLAAAERGWPVIGVDRKSDFLEDLRKRSVRRGLSVPCLRTDLETPFEIPLQEGSAGAVLVFRFLFRPLAGAIQRLLAPGGLLIYETFTSQQASQATGPSNPDFLLRAGELVAMFPELDVVEYRENEPSPGRPASSSEYLAQLVARRPA